MKRNILIVVIAFILPLSFHAQTIIPVDSFTFFHEQADQLFIKKNYDESISLLKQLVNSGDAAAAYELAEMYSKGMGVDVNKDMYKYWLKRASSIESENAEKAKSSRTESLQNTSKSNLTSSPFNWEIVLKQSGEYIEKGGKILNASLAVGVVGGFVGGSLFASATLFEKPMLNIPGYVIIGTTALTSLILAFVGNSYIKLGGRILKGFELNGTEVRLHF